MDGTTTSSTADKVRVPALDLLRLVAVAGVVFFHYGFDGPTGLNGNETALPQLAWLARYGFLGVPVFFVISGFVIAYSAEGRTATEFAIARFSRIYPGFLFCMTLTFVAVMLFGAPHFQTSVSQWLANLVVFAPKLGQPYMDSAYWSLVIEIIFYAWVTAFIARGWFPGRLDLVVTAWLGISILNEITIDSPIFDKVLIADDSGFFATGILLYAWHKGRRDWLLFGLLATAMATAVFQATHNLRWLRAQTDTIFDDWIVAAICLGSILLIWQAIRLRRLPIRNGVVIALGGLTYPFYLLHQKLGYVALHGLEPTLHPAAAVVGTICSIGFASWMTWRFVERPLQSRARRALSNIAQRIQLGRRNPSEALPSRR